MEHEVYVPLSVGSVRAALAETERVARCVPGLQQDAAGTEEAGEGPEAPGAGRIEGRLRVRVGGSTITYRGSLTLTPSGAADGGPETFEITATGGEVRGDGEVKLKLTVTPRAADDGEGTTLVCAGTVAGSGRLTEHEDQAAASAGARLLDRFAAAFAESVSSEPPAGSAEAEGVPEGAAEGPVAGGIGAPGDNERAIPGIPEPEEPERTPLFETEIPPSSLGGDDEDEPADPAALNGAGPGAGPGDEPEPLAAEAAHARRTMIGRSAEEVDHAPPRGRYAPVPAPEPATATATLRWAAPAAAVVVAGAVVLGRVLRRRR